VTMTAAMAAALASLTAALDDPDTDIVHSLHLFALYTAAAIPTYRGLSVFVPHSDPPLALTAMADEADAGDIRTSLHVLLPTTGAGERHPVAVIFYAATPGAFVDLAADLIWLTARPASDFTLDQHLAITSGPDTAGQLDMASDINQAIGVLIGRGYTPQQADWELDTQAAKNRSDRHSAARLILDKLTEGDDDQPFGVQ
jgi:hypothetical protein